jgi:hypothetical protein
MNKKTRKQYGKLPVKWAGSLSTPWKIVQVYLVGPWAVKTPSDIKKLRVFTAMDPAMSSFEII